jgi:hypothetical protein
MTDISLATTSIKRPKISLAVDATIYVPNPVTVAYRADRTALLTLAGGGGQVDSLKVDGDTFNLLGAAVPYTTDLSTLCQDVVNAINLTPNPYGITARNNLDSGTYSVQIIVRTLDAIGGPGATLACVSSGAITNTIGWQEVAYGDVTLDVAGVIAIANPVELSGTTEAFSLGVSGTMSIANPVAMTARKSAQISLEVAGTFTVEIVDTYDPLLPDSVVSTAVFVANAVTGMHSNYTAWGVEALCQFLGKRLAQMPDGIYEIGGTADDGASIDAVLEWPHSDFGSMEKKLVDHAVLAIRGGGGGTLAAELSRDRKRVATLRDNEAGNPVERILVRFTRGLDGRFWRVTYANNGHDFELYEIEAIPVIE